jgi:ADP-heptose:LPS heptosyltransferase
MKIAIVNLSTYEEVLCTINHLDILQNNIVDPKIDLFIEDEVSLQLKKHSLVNNIFPLKLKNISIFDINVKYNNIKFYARNKYDIAIDVQGTKTSSLTSYILSGKVTGYSNKPLSFLYDEKIQYLKEDANSENLKKLFVKTFGLEQ